MTIVRWEPYRDLMGLQDRMNRLFGESYRGAAARTGDDEWALGGSWAPAVDIFEKDGNIEVENNVLTLQGERKFDQEVQKDSFHRVERAYGSFTRSFTLPNVVDTEKIKAEFKDGVLKLTLPKREEAKPKQIHVQVA